MNRPGILRYSIFTLPVITIVYAWIVSQRQFSFNFDSQNKIYQSHSLVQNGFQSEALAYAGQDTVHYESYIASTDGGLLDLIEVGISNTRSDAFSIVCRESVRLKPHPE